MRSTGRRAPDVFAYVRTLLRDRAPPRTSRRSPSSAPTGGGRASTPAAARSGPGCSASPATRRSTSCAAGAGRPRWSPTRPTCGARASRRRPSRRCAARPSAPRWRRLDARDRELVALKFHAGLANAEIAGCSASRESNAGTRLHRAVTEAEGGLSCAVVRPLSPEVERELAALDAALAGERVMRRRATSPCWSPTSAPPRRA